MALKIIKEEQGLEPNEVSDQIILAAKPENINHSNETLEQKAAREIIENLNIKREENDIKVFTLPLKADDLPLDGAIEPTIDDYESIPIQDYGLAMLRGMGWKDEEKKKDTFNSNIPIMRPKGMGLGADKTSKPKPLLIQPAQNEILEMKKNAFVKITSGKLQDYYAQVS